MRGLRCALLFVCLIGLAACTDDRTAPTPAETSAQSALPDGWRWESYRGVEVGVPDDWGWGSGSQRLGQWCINGKDTKPIVGRPGISTLVGCRAEVVGPDPSTLLANTGLVVAFEDATFDDGSPNQLPKGGDRTIVPVRDVLVVVQAPEKLRDQIVSTVHEVKTDHAGCAMTHPVSTHHTQRPSPASEVATLRGVTSVSVCKYALVERDNPRTATLLSSFRRDGSAAGRVVDQIVLAPVGGGPNSPETCVESYGRELIVLRVESSTGTAEIYARYGSCRHNGFDDGVNVRTLTRASMQALIAGPNSLMSGWDGVLDGILAPKL